MEIKEPSLISFFNNILFFVTIPHTVLSLKKQTHFRGSIFETCFKGFHTVGYMSGRA